MITNENTIHAHELIDHIFHDLMPARGMLPRPAQISLSHQMLDAMLGSQISLRFLLEFFHQTGAQHFQCLFLVAQLRFFILT